MKLAIMNFAGEQLSEEVASVYLRGAVGDMTILQNHSPLLSTLREGDVRYQTQSGEKTFSLKSGIVHVENNNIIIFNTLG